MSEWQRGTIGELAKGYRGVTYSAGQLREFKAHDTVTLLRSNNISGGQLNFGDVQIVSERLVSDDQLLTPGDIAVCMSNGSKALVGKSAQLVADSNERFTVGAFCSVFRPQPSVNSRFVAYVFQSSSYRSNLDLALAGTAINNLRNADVEAFACDIPPIEEQSRIAQILDTLDTAIRETEALIDKLKAVKQGLLHDLLTRGIDTNGQLRPPQSEAPQLYKESPLGWIPREWEVGIFGDMISHIIDFRGRTPKKLGMDWGGGNILALSANNVQPGGIDVSREAYLGSERLYQKWMTSGDTQKGDVLLTMEAPLGNVAQIPDEEKYILSQRVIAMRFKPTVILNDFAFWQMQSQLFQQAMVRRSTGSTATGIQRAELVKLYFRAPPVSEQSLIAARLFSIDQMLSDESASLEKQKQEKVGLMDDLLTGRVRVTPLLESVQRTAEPTEA